MLPVVSNLENALMRFTRKRFARVLKVTRRDGQIFRWTDHDSSLTVMIDGLTFETFSPVAAPSWESSRSSTDFDANTSSFFTFMDPAAFTPEDLRIGIWRGSTWELYSPVDWRYPWAGWYEKRRYFLQDHEWTANRLELHLAGLTKRLDVRIGRVYGRECDATVFDDRCTVNPTGFTSGTKTITAVGAHPRIDFESTNTSQADDFWKHGHLAWLSGDNAITGLNDYIVKTSAQTNGVMSLYVATPYDIQVGDTFVVTAGCLKRQIEDCKGKFNNVVNHRGFSHLTNPDAVLASPGTKS